MNYYKRHIGDYAAKAGHLSALEHGVYTLLIDAYYNREEAPTKAEAIRLARARSPEELAAVDAVLAEFFVDVDGKYIQNRIEEELAAFHVKQEVNRQLGARGGQANAKRIATETLSESEAKQEAFREANDKPSHKPLATSHKKAEAGAAAHDLLAEVSPQIAADFRRLRAAKKAAITETAIKGIRREATLAGITLEAALAMCCERGWTGFKAEWVAKDAPAQGRVRQAL